MAPSSRTPTPVRVWAAAGGLLGASMVTLVGVCCGLGPEVILIRAIGSGLVLGFLTALVCRVAT
jgi:hypothetical protein